MKKIALSVLCLFIGSATMLFAVEAGRVSADTGVLVAQIDAPAAGSAVTIEPMTAAPTVSAAPAATPPNPETDLHGFLRTLYEAATTGKWKVFAGLVLLGLVYVSRRWVFGRIAWFRTKFGGVTLAMIVSLGGTFGLALASGASLTMTVALNAIATAVTAAGLWTWLQSVMEPKKS